MLKLYRSLLLPALLVRNPLRPPVVTGRRRICADTIKKCTTSDVRHNCQVDKLAKLSRVFPETNGSTEYFPKASKTMHLLLFVGLLGVLPLAAPPARSPVLDGTCSTFELSSATGDSSPPFLSAVFRC